MILKYKKLLFLLLFMSISIFASSLDVEREICTRIIHGIFQEKSNVKVWSDSQNCQEILTDKSFTFVETPQEADILILTHYEKILVNKPIFVRKYYLLRRYKKRAIGGFYWQKGRPNIIFIKSGLEKFGINLPNEFKGYIEDADQY